NSCEGCVWARHDDLRTVLSEGTPRGEAEGPQLRESGACLAASEAMDPRLLERSERPLVIPEGARAEVEQERPLDGSELAQTFRRHRLVQSLRCCAGLGPEAREPVGA